MNWMSADNITVTYPVLTFAMKGVVNRNRQSFDGPKDPLWKEKYTARGFKIFDTHDSLNTRCGTSCTAIERCSYDIGCMRMPYGQGSVADQFGATSWSLGHRSPRYPCFVGSLLQPSRPLRRGEKDQHESREDGGRGQPQKPEGSRVSDQPETRRTGAGQFQFLGRGEGRGELETRGAVGETGRAQNRGGRASRGRRGRGENSQASTHGRGNGRGQTQTRGGMRGGGQPQSFVGRGGQPQTQGRGGRGQTETRGGVRGRGQPQSPVERGGQPQTRGRGVGWQSESRGAGAGAGRGQSQSRGGRGSRSPARGEGRFHS